MQNIDNIRRNITDNVTLIAVSKTKTVSEIKEAYDFGVRDFGENKVQELKDKFEQLPKDINWHFIGHLQTNKVKYIVGKVYLIHSLDSIKLLKELERQYNKSNLIANVLIQINIGREESKDGIYLEELDDLAKACEECNNVKVKGLMAIIPKGDEYSNRLYFEQLKYIWDGFKDKNFKNISMEYLSMGMTEDYKTAISEGSNMIRIGTGIFGSR
jgi:pyridoxal phosphate enzyme (YggS family)